MAIVSRKLPLNPEICGHACGKAAAQNLSCQTAWQKKVTEGFKFNPSVTFYFILEHAPVEDGGAAALVELSCRFLLG